MILWVDGTKLGGSFAPQNINCSCSHLVVVVGTVMSELVFINLPFSIDYLLGALVTKMPQYSSLQYTACGPSIWTGFA